MKPIKGFDQIVINERREFPTPGGYVAIIKNARDLPAEERLETLIDIEEGEFKGFYQSYYEDTGKWLLRGFHSYGQDADWKPKRFKEFITAVQESNPRFVWDWDENKLRGKKVGVIMREEEYLKNDGTIGTSTRIIGFRSIKTIREGNFKIPDKKTLDKPASAPKSTSTYNSLDDIQF